MSYTLTDDGVLSITGTGPMTDFDFVSSKLNSPWIDDFTTIKRVEVGEGVTHVGNYAFAWFTNGELTVSLPSTLLSLGECAFLQCITLKQIELPASLKTIGNRCFENCTFLETSLPANLELIGEKAFMECTALKTVVLPNSLQTMGTRAFENCLSLETLTMGDGLKEIPMRAFANCQALKAVIGKGNYTYIGGSAFASCDALEQFELSEKLESIGEYILWSNKSLKSLTIPNSVTTLDKYALHAISAMETLHLGSGITTFHTPLINDCRELKHVTIDEANTQLCAVDDVIYTKDKKTLVVYPAAKPDEEFRVPDGVTTIGLLTDEDYPYLAVFYSAKNLKKIVFANSVATYGPYLFSSMNNQKLEEIVLGTGTTTLAQGAFSGITVTGTCLKSLICKATTVPTATSSTFSKNTKVKLYVPSAAMAAYQADANWNKFNFATLTYTITCAGPDANGNYVHTSITSSTGNQNVNIFASLSEGYSVESITVTDENGNNLTVNDESGWWSFDMPEADVTVSATFKYEGVPEKPKDTYAYWTMAGADKLEEGDYLIACDLDLFYGKEDERGCRYAFCMPGTNTLDWTSKDMKHDDKHLVSTKNTFHITPVKGGYYFQLPNGNYLCPDDKAYNGASESKSPVVLSITKSGDYVTITCGTHELKTYSKTYGFTPGYMDNLEQQQGLWMLFMRSGIEEYVADELGFIVDIDKKGGEAKMISCLAAGEWVMPATTEIEGETYTYTSIAAYAMSSSEITSATLPASLLSIEAGAFMECKSLESVTIGESKEGDKKKAARMEKGMEGNLTIDSKAFAGCTTLSTFCCMLTTPPTVEADAFEGVNVEKCMLIVPEESIELYKADAVWGKFLFDDADGINAIARKEAQPAVYDLTGRRTQFNKAGIYIVNGKKTIVK